MPVQLEFEPTTAFTTSRRPRILLVDDDPVYGRAMQRLAARRGVDVDTVATLPDILRAAQQSYDVMIVDFELDSLTGVEVAEWLEHASATTPLVLTSAKTREAAAEAPWPRMVLAFVHKATGFDAVLGAAIAAAGGRLRRWL